MNNKPREPEHHSFLRWIGFAFIVTGIILIVIGFVNKVDSGVNDFKIPNFACIVPGMFLLVFSAPCLFLGSAAKISSMQIKTTKYIQELNKEDLKDIANTSADILSDATTTVSHAFKEGFENDFMYCKHCGSKIDIDSTFCNKCGGKQ